MLVYFTGGALPLQTPLAGDSIPCTPYLNATTLPKWGGGGGSIPPVGLGAKPQRSRLTNLSLDIYTMKIHYPSSITSSTLLYRLMQAGAHVTVACLGSVVAVLVAGVVLSGWGTGWAGILAAFGPEWNPQHGQFGILPMLAGSFLMASLATLLAIPLCLGLMGFLWGEPSCRSSRLLRTPVRFLVRFMVSIPTVVYGFCAVILLVPLMRSAFTGTGMHVLSTCLVLALLILPTMTLVLDNALRQQLGSPQRLALAATALGLTRSQTFWLIALPSQKRWLGTGVLLAFGRALGDTILPLMLSGNAPVLPRGALSSVRTLATHISLLTATEITPQVELTLYLAGGLLLLCSAGVALCGKIVQQKTAGYAR